MKRRINEQGVAHLLFVVIIVVLVVVGGAGYYVYNKQKSESTSNSTSSKEAAAAIKEVCKTVDKDVCKFMANWKENPYYTMVSTSTNNGQKSTMTMQIQGDNNHMTSSGGGQQYESITIGNTMYTKDFSDNKWWKQTLGSNSTTTTNDDADVTFKESSESTPEAQRVVYKKIATEACGSLTCLKYQILDPADTATTNYIWFDNHDYQLRRMQTINADGTSDIAFDYSKFTITAPSPTKEYNVDDYLNSAQ